MQMPLTVLNYLKGLIASDVLQTLIQVMHSRFMAQGHETIHIYDENYKYLEQSLPGERFEGPWPMACYT